MPKDEFDFDDPMELSGVAFRTEAETTDAMCECFIEEFLRMGYSQQQILDLFRNPHYLAPHMVLEKRGEPFIRDRITAAFACWGRPVKWSESPAFPLSPSPSLAVAADPARDPQGTAASEDGSLSAPQRRDTLSPQRGEGRREGCDRPPRSDFGSSTTQP